MKYYSAAKENEIYFQCRDSKCEVMEPHSEQKETRCQIGWRTPEEKGPLNQVNSSHIGLETEVVSMGPACVLPCSLHICYGS